MNTSAPYICSFCGKQFCTKGNASRHMNSCPHREISQLYAQITRLQNDLQKQQERHTQERMSLEQDLQKERELRDRERLNLELKIEKLENQIFEIAKQPNSIHNTVTTTQSHNRTLQIINQLGTYEFDEKWMEQILEENFTQDVFLGGPEKIAELAAHVLLMDVDTQKPKVVCTDVSRRTYRFVDPHSQELQIDAGFQKTHRLIKRPLGQANLRIFTDAFMRNDPDDLHRDQWKANDDFIEDHHKFPEKLHSFLKK